MRGVVRIDRSIMLSLHISRTARRLFGVVILLLLEVCTLAQMAPAEERIEGISTVAVRGEARFIPSGAQRWLPVGTNSVFFPGDRIQVGTNSQLVLKFADRSIVRLRERSDVVIQPPKTEGKPHFGARLLSGMLYFFHRDRPTELEVETQLASAAVRGTEFNLEVMMDGTTLLTVLDGTVELSNALGSVTVGNRQQGLVEPGGSPVLRPAIEALGAIQWTLYYPGVLDPVELNLTILELADLLDSLQAYVAGDLIGAVEWYPAERGEISAAERVYKAALLLGVGQVAEAEMLIEGIDGPLASALRTMIGAVTLKPESGGSTAPSTASEWLAESYRRQALTDLPGALEAARRAVAISPSFGFAQARLGELEFSLGRTGEAAKSIAKALEGSPRNAQAVALNGFLLAAKNKYREAIAEFERAIEFDPLLANSWLGRGLVRIRVGESAAGRSDLLAAAALEPQRAFLRSYLGKAWTDVGERDLARRELEIAKELDARDPTAWLYSALLHEQYNRINEAVRDLEHSRELNQNRAIYRSRFLLDQDQAVRAANLARIYRDAGMSDWSVLTAGRAVSADYANYSAHLFLANSYALQIDPIHRRFETPAQAEYLIANLLAPVGAGILSPAISANEYSYLFERNRLGIVSETEYLSRGAWTQSAAHFGTFKDLAYSIEGLYQSDPGQRENQDFEQKYLSFQIKPRLSERDTLVLRADFLRFEGGDLADRYHPGDYNPRYRSEEEQVPTVLVGYRHEWAPGSQTLLLAGRVDHEASFLDPFRPGIFAAHIFGAIGALQDFFLEERYRAKLEIYTIEPQHIWQTGSQSTIIGARAQRGEFDTRYFHINPSPPVDVFFPLAPDPIADEFVNNDFERLSAYLYHRHEIFSSLELTAGISYDYLSFPQNWRFAPVSSARENQDQLSPKAGFIWQPLKGSVVRGAYTRSLAGATIDQSYQIEPTLVAGFNQTYRSLIPESLAGGNTGAEFETWSLSLEQQIGSRTFLALTGEVLDSEVERMLGVYEMPDFLQVERGSLLEELDYRERGLLLSIRHLLGEGLSLGGRYRVSEANYHSSFPNLPEGVPVFDVNLMERPAAQPIESILHEATLSVLYNHPSGFFAGVDANWYGQSNHGYQPELEGDDFWQFHALAGYRFPRRRVELSGGLLNFTDQDYRLAPINLRRQLPRERTFVARARFSF
jgi:Tfp pilus assembly protein PilF